MGLHNWPMLHDEIDANFIDQARKEAYLNDYRAVIIREKYPSLKEAWEHYKVLWALTVTEDDLDVSDIY
jgi:hypothetical protein